MKSDREKEPFRLFRASYKGRDGKKHQVAKWWIETRDHLATVRRFPGLSDKTQTKALARQIVRLVACRMSGEQPGPDLTRWLEQIPPKQLKRFGKIHLLDGSRLAALKPLREHLADFYSAMLNKGDTERQARQVVIRAGKVLDGWEFIIWLADLCEALRKEALRKKSGKSLPFFSPEKARQIVAHAGQVPDGCGFTVWSEISADRIASHLAVLREGNERLSAQTSNFYLQSVKQFCRWMVLNHRASESPVAHLAGLNVKTDRRHDHVQLEVDEVRKLLAAAMAGPEREGMAGVERRLLYKLAIESGLRANELRTLKVSCFDFTVNTITVQAGYSKHRREDVLPLRPETAAELRAFLAGRDPGAKVFGGKWKQLTGQTAQIIREDLAAAGIEYQDAAGRFRDFHALRHTCGSWLGANGVPLPTIKEIMRHGDLRTTSRYAHSLRGQEAKAIEGLPDLSLPGPESEQARATGTDGRPAENGPEKLGGKLGGIERVSMPSVRFGAQNETSTLNTAPVSERAENKAETQFSAGNEDRSRRDSNPRNLSVLRFSRPLTDEAQTLSESALTKNAKNDLAENLASFADLAGLAELWPRLPKDIRRTILHVARASVKTKDR